MLFALLVGGVGTVQAQVQAEYYVDGDSGNDANNGLGPTTAGANKPWLTIRKARDVINLIAGALTGTVYVYVKPSAVTYRGFHQTPQTKAGSASFHIIWRGDGKDRLGATIVWTTGTTGFRGKIDAVGNDQSGFWIQGAYTEVHSIEVTNTKNAGAAPYGDMIELDGANNSLVDDCWLHNGGGNNTSGVDFFNASNSSVQNCMFGNPADATAQVPGWAAIDVGSVATSTNVTITGCAFVRVKANNTNSIIFVTDGSDDCVIRNNLMYNNGDAWGVQVTKTGVAEVYPVRTVITGNTIVDTAGGAGTRGCVSLSSTIATGAVVRNNIMYTGNNNHWTFYANSTVAGMNYDCFWRSDTTISLLYYNGVSYWTAAAPTFATFQSTIGQEKQGLAADPLLVSTSSPRLQSTFGYWNGTDFATRSAADSPCIDGGTPSAIVTTTIAASATPATVSVSSTRGYPAAGPTIYVREGANQRSFTYTGMTASSLTGVTWTGGAAGVPYNAGTARVYVDDPSTSATPPLIADYSNETADNGGRKDMGCAGVAYDTTTTFQASLSGVQGAEVTWIGGNVKTWSFTNTGESSTTTGWNNPANWSTAAVPFVNAAVPGFDDASIPRRANDPVVDASKSCGNLTISNAVNNSPAQSGGLLTLNNASYTIAAAGTVQVDAVGADRTPAISMSNGELDIAGGFTLNSVFSASGGTVKLNGGSAQTIGGTVTTGPTFRNLTFANTAGGTNLTFNTGAAGTTMTVNGAWTVSSSSTVSAANRVIALSGASAAGTWSAPFTLVSGTLDMYNGTQTLGATAVHTIQSGATLRMDASAAPDPTLSFTASPAATLNVNGSFIVTSSGGRKAAITGGAGLVDMNLLGATVDVSGMTYSNGNGNGLEFGQAAGPFATVLQFRNVDFTVAFAGGRHMTFTGPGGSKMAGIDCTFDMSFGAGANVQVNKDGAGAGDAVVSMIRGLGGPGGGGEGPGPLFDRDADADGNGPVATGYCDWFDGGDRLTANPWTGADPEVRTNPDTFTGVQGFLTPQYNWFPPYTFVGNYALVRSDEDKDLNDDGDVADGGEPSSTGNGTKEDLVYALDATGKIKTGGTYATTNPFRVPRTLGRVIGPPWTATIGTAGPGVDVVMFVTTTGYIFVVKDDGFSLATYAPYPRQPWSGAGYPAVPPRDADTAYSPLMFYAGSDYSAETTVGSDDRFIFCGASGGTNKIFVTRCFDPGLEAKSLTGWPLGYASRGGRAARSWPAVQFYGGDVYLHLGTDCDDGDGLGNDSTSVAANRGHIFRVKCSNFDGIGAPAIDLEYNGTLPTPPGPPYTPGRPGNHLRGGMQLLDDPAIANDARIYVGCFEDKYDGSGGFNDASPANWRSFFAIRTDGPVSAAYDEDPGWTGGPALLGTGDVDSYATFDSGQIYVGDSSGVFYGINRTTGATVWSPTLEAGQPIRSSPVSFVDRRGSGRLFVGNDNGKVFQINPATGSIVRTWRLGDTRKVRSLSIVGDASNDYIVAITSDGYVFLIKVS